MTSPQDIASEAYDYFTRDTRTNGEQFVKLKDDAPSWLSEAVHAAHGDMMPDDTRYELIRETVSTLADADDWEYLFEALDGDVDVYTAKLTAWLASHLDRVQYVNDAVNECGGWPEITFEQALMRAQLMEREEIAAQLVEAFRAELEERENAQEAGA